MAYSSPYGGQFNSFSVAGSDTTVAMSPAAEKVRRHPKYYLNGGDVHFLVENWIFRVHRYFFERESQFFREKLGAPPPPGQPPKGSSDVNPFTLDDIREEDFSRFLWVFYNPKYYVYDANAEEWISILKLSHLWNFAEIKQMACRYLEDFTLDPIRKIELYQAYDVDKRLLIPAYTELVNRLEPLSLEEGRRLTLETALLIATARECARGKLQSGKHTPVSASVKPDAMVDIIKEVFRLSAPTPSSPSLEPLAEGRGPSAFTATPMSPSRIITAPPQRDGAKSPTPMIATNSQSHILTTAEQPEAPIPLTPAKTVPTNTISALPTSAPAESKKLAPEAPPYLQTSFSQRSATDAPNTPLKSAVSPNPANGSEPSNAAAVPPASANGAAKAEADKPKPGQSSVRQKTEKPRPTSPTATKTGNKAAKVPTPSSKTQLKQTGKTARDQAPPQHPPPTDSRASSTPKVPTEPRPMAEEAMVAATASAATTTTGEARRAATSEEGVAMSRIGSSGYTTDITNSADDAGVVGNENDDVSTSMNTSGAAKQESKNPNKNKKAKAQEQAGEKTQPAKAAKVEVKPPTRQSTPRPEVSIVIPTAPSLPTAVTEAVAGVLPQLLGSDAGAAGAAAPSDVPAPTTPAGDAVETEKQATPPVSGQGKEAEGAAETSVKNEPQSKAPETKAGDETTEQKDAGDLSTTATGPEAPSGNDAGPNGEAEKPKQTDPSGGTAPADAEKKTGDADLAEKPQLSEAPATITDAPPAQDAQEKAPSEEPNSAEASKTEAESRNAAEDDKVPPAEEAGDLVNLGDDTQQTGPSRESSGTDAWDLSEDEPQGLTDEPVIVNHPDVTSTGTSSEPEGGEVTGDVVIVKPEDAATTADPTKTAEAIEQESSATEKERRPSSAEALAEASLIELGDGLDTTGDAAPNTTDPKPGDAEKEQSTPDANPVASGAATQDLKDEAAAKEPPSTEDQKKAANSTETKANEPAPTTVEAPAPPKTDKEPAAPDQNPTVAEQTPPPPESSEKSTLGGQQTEGASPSLVTQQGAAPAPAPKPEEQPQVKPAPVLPPVTMPSPLSRSPVPPPQSSKPFDPYAPQNAWPQTGRGYTSPASSRPPSVHSMESRSPWGHSPRMPAATSSRVEQPPTPKSGGGWFSKLTKVAVQAIDSALGDGSHDHRGPPSAQQQQQQQQQQYFNAQYSSPSYPHQRHQEQAAWRDPHTGPGSGRPPQTPLAPSPMPTTPSAPAPPPKASPAMPPVSSPAPPPQPPALTTPAEQTSLVQESTPPAPQQEAQAKDKRVEKETQEDEPAKPQEVQPVQSQAPEQSSNPQEKEKEPPTEPQGDKQSTQADAKAPAGEQPEAQQDKAKAGEEPSSNTPKPALHLDTSGADPITPAGDDDDVPPAQVASSVPKRMRGVEGDDSEGTGTATESEPASSRPNSPEVEKNQVQLGKNHKKNQKKKKKGGKS